MLQVYTVSLLFFGFINFIMKKNIKSFLVQVGLFGTVKTAYLYFEFIFVRLLDNIITSKKECSKGTLRCDQNVFSGNYKYYLLGKDTPICCASNLYEILKDVTEVLEKNSIQYFINYGTFLGSVRHKGLIPWDTDIDIGILEKDVEKVTDILNESYNDKYMIKKSGGYIRVFYSQTNTLHLDFDIWHDEGDSITMYHDLEHGSLTCKKSDVFPTRKYDFYDLKLQGPNNVRMLEQAYGKDYMNVAYKKWGYTKSKKYEITKGEPAKIKRQ
ncbi:hypothetical protein AL538_10695 [Vibrio harveyi]|uniref:LicD/FKTN/FKRP nucleotidyltransferase domain-containing protein n=2 Tax=Vibrio harveyi TaxID=669 RepID=A0ABN4KY94_VIBHA|nr:hypothetical protein AL538_10695 [Vibrio harveyi]